jgi:chromosome partitioning protein
MLSTQQPKDMTTISITAQKGGVGKTTTAITLASYLARQKYRVLLIDIDAQGNSSTVLLKNYSDLNRRDTVASILLDNDESLIYHQSSNIPDYLYICPSHDDLSIAESLLSTLPAKERRLEFKLKPIKDQFDFIIIDCPPNVNDLPQNAMVASDYILVPFQADSFNMRGIVLLLKQMGKIQKYFNPDLKILGFLSVAYDQRKTITREIYSKMVEKFGDKVFKTKLPVNSAVTYAHTAKQDIFEFEPQSPIAMAYSTLIENEILPVINN